MLHPVAVAQSHGDARRQQHRRADSERGRLDLTGATAPIRGDVDVDAGTTRRRLGDNCSGEANPIDALFTLRFDAGLGVETGACPAMGAAIEVLIASRHIWGDVDCGGEVSPVNSLKLLRFDAGLDVAQAQGCPGLGTSVTNRRGLTGESLTRPASRKARARRLGRAHLVQQLKKTGPRRRS